MRPEVWGPMGGRENSLESMTVTVTCLCKVSLRCSSLTPLGHRQGPAVGTQGVHVGGGLGRARGSRPLCLLALEQVVSGLVLTNLCTGVQFKHKSSFSIFQEVGLSDIDLITVVTCADICL